MSRKMKLPNEFFLISRNHNEKPWKNTSAAFILLIILLWIFKSLRKYHTNSFYHVILKNVLFFPHQLYWDIIDMQHCVGLHCIRASLVAQMVKESACNAGDEVQFLGWEDPLKKEMSTRSSILAWRIPWTEEPGGLQSMWLQRVRHNWATHTHTLSKVYGIMFWLSCNMAWSLQSIISYRHTHTHKLFSWWELSGLTLLTTFIHAI